MLCAEAVIGAYEYMFNLRIYGFATVTLCIGSRYNLQRTVELLTKVNANPVINLYVLTFGQRNLPNQYPCFSQTNLVTSIL